MTILSSLLIVIFLSRSFSHIASRSNWYIASLLIFFFLTSTYDFTYLEFLSSPDINDLQFNYLRNLRSTWFSGNYVPLLLSGLFFFITKISLYKLSNALFIELIFISLSSILILSKILINIESFPICIGIATAMLFHYFKIKKFSSENSENLFEIKIRNFKFLNIKNIWIFTSLYYFFVAIIINPEFENLSLMSISHLYRIVIILLIIFFTYFYDFSYKNKVFFGVLPFTFVYLGLIISSIFSNSFTYLSSPSTMSLDSMTSIALIPLLEIIQRKYHLINYYENIESFFKIKRKLFKYTVNFILTLIIITYILYLLTQ